MKIYRIAQEFQIIPQNPGAQNDPNVQLQNLQNSQNALQYFESVMTAAETLMADLRNLEDTMGIGDIGLRNQFQDVIKQAATQTPAFNLLAQMNLISSIDNLMNQNELSNIKNLIITNIQSISDQSNSIEQANQ